MKNINQSNAQEFIPQLESLSIEREKLVYLQKMHDTLLSSTADYKFEGYEKHENIIKFYKSCEDIKKYRDTLLKKVNGIKSIDITQYADQKKIDFLKEKKQQDDKAIMKEFLQVTKELIKDIAESEKNSQHKPETENNLEQYLNLTTTFVKSAAENIASSVEPLLQESVLAALASKTPATVTLYTAYKIGDALLSLPEIYKKISNYCSEVSNLSEEEIAKDLGSMAMPILNLLLGKKNPGMKLDGQGMRNVGLALGEKMKSNRGWLYFGGIKVCKQKYHRELKGKIFDKVGTINFSHIVGDNPNVDVIKGKIVLIGQVEKFRNKSFATELLAKDYLKD